MALLVEGSREQPLTTQDEVIFNATEHFTVQYL